MQDMEKLKDRIRAKLLDEEVTEEQVLTAEDANRKAQDALNAALEDQEYAEKVFARAGTDEQRASAQGKVDKAKERVKKADQRADDAAEKLQRLYDELREQRT